MTDFYKTGHYKQYPKGTSLVYSNFTARSDNLAQVLSDFDHKTVHFGLQGICQWLLTDLWNDNFFALTGDEAGNKIYQRLLSSIDKKTATELADRFYNLHNLGYLPIHIKALPEGSRVPIRTASWTIQNTLPEFYWLTNYLETQLSSEYWKPMTTATIAYEYRRLLDRSADKTGSDKGFVSWQGHDFSARGMSGIYDAAQCGAGHLLSFLGTDTVSAIDYVDNYYKPKNFIGGSVPATEHSVMCLGGKDNQYNGTSNEYETIKRLIKDIYPSGIVSIVSDTWDFWKVITQTAADLKDVILSRHKDNIGNCKVVFRPDSGDPVKIICGDPDETPGSPAYKGAVQCLWEIFGGTVTKTGHKLLDSHVGLIYGDSITLDRASRITEGLASKGFASGNIVFGIGSYTYQYITRDTFGSAIKATYGVVEGQGRELEKTPKTDNGMKNSACGLIRIEEEGNSFIQYDRQTTEQEGQGELKTIFKDSEVINPESFDVIRNRLHPNIF